MRDFIGACKFSFMFALLVITSVGFFIYGGITIFKNYQKEQEYLNSEEYKNLLITQENCEHNYITCGSGQGRDLKVYTKCTKCGKIYK